MKQLIKYEFKRLVYSRTIRYLLIMFAFLWLAWIVFLHILQTQYSNEMIAHYEEVQRQIKDQLDDPIYSMINVDLVDIIEKYQNHQVPWKDEYKYYKKAVGLNLEPRDKLNRVRLLVKEKVPYFTPYDFKEVTILSNLFPLGFPIWMMFIFVIWFMVVFQDAFFHRTIDSHPYNKVLGSKLIIGAFLVFVFEGLPLLILHFLFPGTGREYVFFGLKALKGQDFLKMVWTLFPALTLFLMGFMAILSKKKYKDH